MSETLPLWCRLAGHGWKPSRLWHPTQTEAWRRQTCRRCATLDIPTPEKYEPPRP